MAIRRNIPAIFMLMALGLLALCALFYSPQVDAPAWGDVCLLAGGVALLAALWTGGDPLPPTPTTRHDRPFRRVEIGIAAAGVLCLWLMAEGGGPLEIPGLAPMDTDLQLVLFIAGVGLVALGLAGLPRRSGGGRCSDALLLAPVIVVGFGLRAWNLEDAVHSFVDEMHFAEGMVYLWENPNAPLLTAMGGIPAFPKTYVALQSHTVALFGPTLTGLRAVSVIAGTLTIPAVYVLARAIFDRPTGLIAAVVLAAFPPHVHFSRLAMNNIADPLFGVLALGFLARGRGRADYALAGICLGMTQYFYEGGKLVYPVAALGVLGIAWLRAATRPRRRDVALFALAALLVAAPLFYVQATWGVEATPRLNDMQLETHYWTDLLLGAGGPARLQTYAERQLIPALAHFVNEPDAGAFYYAGHTALVLPYLLPFFLIGVVYALWRRHPGGYGVLLVLALTVLGNSLLIHPHWTARFVVAIPLLPVLIAAGLRVVLVVGFHPTPRQGSGTPAPDALAAKPRGEAIQATGAKGPASPRGGVGAKSSGAFVALLMVAGLVIPQAAYYVGPHLEAYNRQLRQWYDHQDVGWRARDLPPNTKILLLTDDGAFAPHYEVMAGFWDVEIDVQLAPPYYFLSRGASFLPRDQHLAFFIKPDDRELLRYLNRVFDLPEPQFSPYNVPEDRQYALYFIENPAVAREEE